MYSADKPIKELEEDLLGRSEFAQHLAEAITSLSTTDTFVVGLYGEWGSGKTSVLNLTEKILYKEQEEDQTPKMKIIRFNPWGYTDDGQLVGQFFSAIASEFKYDRKDGNQEKVGEAIEKYAFALEFTKYIPVVGTFLTPLQTLAEKVGKTIKDRATSRKYDVLLQKENVIKTLRNSETKLVIIIDDLDRLPNKQIRMIFQLVNSVANFPNTTYVLSFDFTIVCRALASEQGCRGEDYLEKIVQIPFILPVIPAAKIERVLFLKLDELLIGSLDELFDDKHWQNVYRKCLSPFITSIRDVVRLINTLEFKYVPLKNSINPIDFIGITAIEIFAPDLFSWIRCNKYLLTVSTGHIRGSSGNERNEIRSLWNQKFKDLFGEDAERFLQSVQVLFPLFSSTLDLYTIVPADELRAKLHIGHSERFDAYFTLLVENKLVLFPSIMASLNQLDTQSNVEYLRDVIRNGLIKEYFLNIRGLLSSIPDNRCTTLITSFISIIGDIPAEETGFFSQSSETQCIYHIQDLLLRIENEQERLDLFLYALKKSNLRTILSLSQLINIFEIALGRLQGEGRKEGDVVFSEENMKLIETLYIKKIRTLSATDNFLSYPDITIGNFLWKTLDFSSYSAYMDTKFLNPLNILLYIARVSRQWRSSTPAIGWSFNLEEDFDILPVDKAMSAIRLAVNDGTYMSLPREDLEKISAFELFILSGNTRSLHDIDQKKAQKNIEKWMSESK